MALLCCHFLKLCHATAAQLLCSWQLTNKRHSTVIIKLHSNLQQLQHLLAAKLSNQTVVSMFS
jgi:hypothetical protein